MKKRIVFIVMDMVCLYNIADAQTVAGTLYTYARIDRSAEFILKDVDTHQKNVLSFDQAFIDIPLSDPDARKRTYHGMIQQIVPISDVAYQLSHIMDRQHRKENLWLTPDKDNYICTRTATGEIRLIVVRWQPTIKKWYVNSVSFETIAMLQEGSRVLYYR